MVEIVIIVCGDISKDIFQGIGLEGVRMHIKHTFGDRAYKGKRRGIAWDSKVRALSCGGKSEFYEIIAGTFQEVIPFIIVPIGYKGEKKDVQDKYKTECIYFEK